MKINRGSTKNFGAMVLTAITLFVLLCMLLQPAKFMQCSLSGISAWAFNVLPSVLPFMFFTRLLSALDVMPALTRPFGPITSRLFKTPAISIYAFAMAVLSGYPVGTKMVADLYLQGSITKEDAFKMTSFCSTSGPMFIIGAVGIGMFKNTKIGYILFLSHVLSAALNGILFRSLKIKNDAPQNFGEKVSTASIQAGFKMETNPTNKEENIPQNKSTDGRQSSTLHASPSAKNLPSQSGISLSDIVTNSVLSILSVGCIITIFFIVIECFAPLLSLFPSEIAYFLEGCLEITRGCLDISALNNLPLAITLCSFVISFGGISTILQSLTMLSALKMPVRLFVFQKIMHGVLSALVTILLLIVI